MAIFKCKMCGGDLNISADDRIVECEYCGTTQTVPSADNEKKMTLFNRANRLRLNSEFDKAAVLYEQIIAEFPEEAEAYWGLCLCNYGIEYVDDPATGNKIPTCHRASFQKLREDENFNLAMEYSDAIAQKVYRDEAREIDRINAEILSVSRNEKPYDVFICYKETDDFGGRTPDSVMAQEVYDALTDKGYKVFFSRITLEDKLGLQYEPYIFAALNSAKVMLAFGTKYEYFHAVWVKNEWSRFLKLAAKDKTKKLVPVYKDMDPYDLPDEFKALQAQDMSKLGAAQDLARGVGKLLPADALPVAETVVSSAAVPANVAGLLERAFLFLEDGKWTEADEYCEKVLDNNPKCAEAYLGKLMAELQIKKREDLKDAAEPFDTKDNCQKASRFDAKIAKELADANAYICERNLAAEKEAKRAAEESRKEDVYRTACEIASNAVVISSFKFAIEKFDSIPDYKDARQRADECRRKIEDLRIKQEKEEAERKQREAEAVEATQIAKEKRRKQIKKAIKIGTPIVVGLIVLLTAFLIIMNTVIIPANKYKNAVMFAENGEHGKAVALFDTLGDYKEAKALSIKSHYLFACDLEQQKRYLGAMLEYRKAGNYEDAREKSHELALLYQKSITGLISAGSTNTVGVKADGSAIATQDTRPSVMYNGQGNVSGWNNIVAIAAGNGAHTVGLKSDGSVVAVGFKDDGACDVSGWTDIVEIAAGHDHTVGLKSDGTVVATKILDEEEDCGQSEVSGWSDIVAISAGRNHTLGLKADGTVVAVGSNSSGQCNVNEWTDIVAVSAGEYLSVGLKSDGTVIATDKDIDVTDWTDIIAVAAGQWHVVGLKADGSVVAEGDNYFGQSEVTDWSGIIAISASCEHTVGLKSNGTVVSTGNNDCGQCYTSGFVNMKLTRDLENNSAFSMRDSSNASIKVESFALVQ